MNIYQLIHLHGRSVTPKYLQVSNSMADAVTRGKIGKTLEMPSISELRYEPGVIGPLCAYPQTFPVTYA